MLAASSRAADHKLAPLKEKIPDVIAPALRKALPEEGLRIVNDKGKPVADLWIRTAVPRQSRENPTPGDKFKALEEGTFLGVIRYHQKHYDFRDTPVPGGIYTMRLGVQPDDGDHLGMSKTRDFAILCPPKADQALDPISTEDAVELSTEVSQSDHPAIIWIQPVKGETKKLPQLHYQDDDKFLILNVKISLQGEKDEAVRMGLVVVGISPEA